MSVEYVRMVNNSKAQFAMRLLRSHTTLRIPAHGAFLCNTALILDTPPSVLTEYSTSFVLLAMQLDLKPTSLWRDETTDWWSVGVQVPSDAVLTNFAFTAEWNGDQAWDNNWGEWGDRQGSMQLHRRCTPLTSCCCSGTTCLYSRTQRLLAMHPDLCCQMSCALLGPRSVASCTLIHQVLQSSWLLQKVPGFNSQWIYTRWCITDEHRLCCWCGFLPVQVTTTSCLCGRLQQQQLLQLQRHP